MSIRTERCPTCKGSGLIKVDDWLIKGKTEEELAREKKEALADIVEVVRCKDCKHSVRYECKNDACYKFTMCRRRDSYSEEVTDDDFCSYGERRADDAKR